MPNGPHPAPSEPFDEAEEPKPSSPSAAELLKLVIANEPDRAARKLSFATQCGLFYALRQGAWRRAVARAYDLSLTTVSVLAHCESSGHYGRVAEEYAKLGEAAFAERYFTHEMWARIVAAKDNATPARQHGPNPRADKYAGLHIIGEQSFFIFKSDIEPAGWYWSPGETADEIQRYGVNGNDEPYRTSAIAFDDLFEQNGLESPRPKPGRPKVTGTRKFAGKPHR